MQESEPDILRFKVQRGFPEFSPGSYRNARDRKAIKRYLSGNDIAVRNRVGGNRAKTTCKNICDFRFKQTGLLIKLVSGLHSLGS